MWVDKEGTSSQRAMSKLQRPHRETFEASVTRALKWALELCSRPAELAATTEPPVTTPVLLAAVVAGSMFIWVTNSESCCMEFLAASF